MHAALDSIRLNRLDVIHAGEHTFLMKERIRAVAFDRLEEDIHPLDLRDGDAQGALPSA